MGSVLKNKTILKKKIKLYILLMISAYNVLVLCALFHHAYCNIEQTGKEVICQIFETSEERYPGDDNWECSPDIYRSATTYLIRNIKREIAERIQKGEHWVKLSLPPQDERRLIPWEPVPDETNITFVNGPHMSSRRRGPDKTIGTRSILIIRVTGLDVSCSSTRQQLADQFFGSYGRSVSLNAQYTACSKGMLSFYPAVHPNATLGVVEVNINLTVTNNQKVLVVKESREAARSAVANLESFDHVSYCIPLGSKESDGTYWPAYAQLDGLESFFPGPQTKYLSFVTHEIGHNLGLRHAADINKGGEYGDFSCTMGLSDTKEYGPLKCFNGAHTYELQWFIGCHTTIPKWDTHKTIYLIGAADFNNMPDCCEPDEAVTIEIITGWDTDIFVAYNKAVGPNADTPVDFRNKVMVTIGNPAITSYWYARLTESQEYVHPTTTVSVRIKFCELVSGRARIGIGLNDTSNICLV